MSSEHHASVAWQRTSPDFTYETYNRAHEMRFKDGEIVLPSSGAPEFRGDAERVDPEEAYVAALSSCHMLTFLAICARKRLTVETYEDDAVGFLDKGDKKKLWITHVVLKPRVKFASEVDAATLDQLHHLAHEDCFIANSVNTEIAVEPRA